MKAEHAGLRDQPVRPPHRLGAVAGLIFERRDFAAKSAEQRCRPFRTEHVEQFIQFRVHGIVASSNP